MRCNIDAAIFIVDVTAVTLSWASDVTPEEGFTFVAIHPGSVETDMNNATFGWVIFFSTYFSVSSSSSSSFTRLHHTSLHSCQPSMGIAMAAQWPASHNA